MNNDIVGGNTTPQASPNEADRAAQRRGPRLLRRHPQPPRIFEGSTSSITRRPSSHPGPQFRLRRAQPPARPSHRRHRPHLLPHLRFTRRRRTALRTQFLDLPPRPLPPWRRPHQLQSKRAFPPSASPSGARISTTSTRTSASKTASSTATSSNTTTSPTSPTSPASTPPH